MLTKKIANFSDDLLNTVRGILGEAKKCPADCECPKCEAEQMKEGSMPTADEPTDANKKTADKVRAMMAKEKKPMKEEILEMVNEASSGLADKAKKSGVSLSTLKKVYARGIAAWNSGHRPGTTPQQWAHARVNSYITKGKGTYHGADKDLRSEGTDMPFDPPYSKPGERKDAYGNKVKNVAKYLAKKAMNDLAKKNEEAEHNNCGTPECCGQCDTPGQIDEISAKTAVNAYAKRNAKAFNDGQYDDEAEKDYNKLDKQGDRIQRKFGDKTVRKAQSAAYKKIFGEEVENLDETAKIVAHLQKRYGDNIRKSHVRSAASDFGVDASKLAKAVRTKLGKNMLDEEDDGWYTHSQMHGSKKSEKHPKGISAAEWKSGIRWHHGKNKRINIKEEAEELDEISKGTLGRYINKAKDSIDMASYRQGHKEAHGSSSKPLEKKLTKRHKGISTAVNKLTKEEAEQIDELSKGTMGRYINKAADRMSTQGVTAGLKIAADEKSKKNFDTIAKRQKGIATAVSKLTKEEQDFIDSLNNDMFEEVEITEARGRPRKAGAKDFTIHPKTKEKLMHNNPEHMKKIEVLQKNGILEKPKVEAGQHIMNQLSKAKTSMLGGSKINFTHGDSKEVSGTHAAKILTKYAGMKPNEKEDFQKFVGHSHENLMKHV
jgi:hypothetical protein